MICYSVPLTVGILYQSFMPRGYMIPIFCENVYLNLVHWSSYVMTKTLPLCAISLRYEISCDKRGNGCFSFSCGKKLIPSLNGIWYGGRTPCFIGKKIADVETHRCWRPPFWLSVTAVGRAVIAFQVCFLSNRIDIFTVWMLKNKPDIASSMSSSPSRAAYICVSELSQHGLAK